MTLAGWQILDGMTLSADLQWDAARIVTQSRQTNDSDFGISSRLHLSAEHTVDWVLVREENKIREEGKTRKTRGRRNTQHTSTPASQLTSAHGSDSKFQWHINQPISMTDNYEMTTLCPALSGFRYLGRVHLLPRYHCWNADSQAIRVSATSRGKRKCLDQLHNNVLVKLPPRKLLAALQVL